jgi:hypothetical protein
VPYGRLLASEAEKLAEDFQGRLLVFRLQRHRAVRQSRFDLPTVPPETRRLAAALGPVMEGAPEAQARLIEALKATSEDEKSTRSQQPATVILEVLLAACHSRNPTILNAEVTRLANSLLIARGERLQFSPKTVGGIIRQELGLLANRHAAGFELRLDQTAIAQIHCLADCFGALSLLKPFVGCAFCEDLSRAKRSDRNEVHEVHDVQMEGGKNE